MKVIDIHIHGIGGFDTRTASEDDILHIAELHGRQGVSEIILTVYSATIEIMRGNMQTIQRAMEKQRSTGPASARIIGMHLEGPFLNPTKCGALTARSFLQPNEYNLKKLVDGYEDTVKIITIAPESEGAVKLIKDISDMGIIASMGHSDATYAEAEAGFHAGARGITHLFNAMRGMHHRELGLAGFGLTHKEIYIEVIADPFHLDPEIIKLIFAVKNPDRIIITSDTVKETMVKTGAQGITNMQDKLLGGSTTIRESSKRLVQMGLNEEVVMKSVSENPERYLTER